MCGSRDERGFVSCGYRSRLAPAGRQRGTGIEVEANRGGRVDQQGKQRLPAVTRGKATGQGAPAGAAAAVARRPPVGVDQVESILHERAVQRDQVALGEQLLKRHILGTCSRGGGGMQGQRGRGKA